MVALHLEEHTTGSHDSAIGGCGTVSGTSSLVGTLPAPSSGAPDGALRDNGGAGLIGIVEAPMPAGSMVSADQTRQGCRHGPNGVGYVPCTTSFPDFPLPAGRRGVGLRAGPGETMVHVQWPILGPAIGDLARTSDAGCNVAMSATLSIDDHITYTPLTTFRQRTPFTLVNGGQLHFDRDSLGRAADITYSWSYSITLQRVTEAGVPLS